jgi:hypothetical protein
MDRTIVYPGSIPLDTDILGLNRNVMIGIAALSQAVLGDGSIVDGLACTPTTPASMTINIGPGSITALAPIDVSAYGSMPADNTDQIIKTGINRQAIPFTLTAPAISGQSINYLIEAAFAETDTNPVVLPYVNAANPAQPYSGPNNSGGAQNTMRVQSVQLQLKPGAAAASGTQTTAPVDNGWVGLYVITVNYGQTAIIADMILTLPGAPFLSFKLPSLRPGFSAMQTFNASGVFTVPPGVTTARVTVIGGGGAAGYHAVQPGAGGGGGGSATGIVSGLLPGQTIPVTVGAAGVAPTSPAYGGNGGTSSFGAYISATGGQGGQGGTASLFATAGGAGGAGFGGQFNQSGAMGDDGSAVSSHGGSGGGAGRGRGASGPLPGLSASGYGGGGGGGGASIGASPTGSPGGAGGAGIVIVEY